MTTTLTPRQQAILDAIRLHWHKHSYSPTIRELCNATRSSSTSVMAEDVAALASLGLVRVTPNIARSIVLVQPRVPKEIAVTLLSALKFDREEWGITNDNIKAEAWVKGEL